MELLKIKDQVKVLLEQYPQLRDSDRKLIATFWAKELGTELKYLSGEELLRKYAAGKLTTAASIVRDRAKLQELHPSLRGELYYKRKGMEDQVKAQLRMF